MGDGFAVSKSALAETADGLDASMAALARLGFSEAAAEGRGFSRLALSEPQLGDASLQAAFSGFCDRWSWGVRSMVQDGNQIATRLGVSKQLYSSAEQAIAEALAHMGGTLKGVVIDGRP
jgi:hypothetical protein